MRTKREKEDVETKKLAQKIMESLVIDLGKLTIEHDYLPHDSDAHQKEERIKQALYKKYPKEIVDSGFEFYKKLGTKSGKS